MTPARRSGLLVPLFSAPSTTSWGIGDIGDITALTTWLAGAGQRILQMLPLNEMAPGTQSPYSALSAMAIDPIYICVADMLDFQAAGGLATLDAADRAALARAQHAGRVEYAIVRPIKERALRTAFAHFVSHEWRVSSPRALAMRAYMDAESWWLTDYALFRALHDRYAGTTWTEWPEAVKTRMPDALAAVARELADSILFYQYLQWIAGQQWAHARAAAAQRGVALFGDLPFMVDLHSADVWVHQATFHLDRSVGVPPDAFSATGQDWGMPAYDWDAFAAAGFRWLRDRARRSAALFDGYRVDHLVGFYRTYSRPRNGVGDAAFDPSTEDAQIALGEQVLRIFGEPGAEIIAEDLGVVPDFVRASLKALDVPGFRVFRWERQWRVEGQPFTDPVDYPSRSVATTGTHDTEPLITWWESAPIEEKTAMAAVPSIKATAGDVDLLTASFVPTVRDILLDALLGSGSEIVLVPIQDVFGWSDRINQPATVNDINWSYRLPWAVDSLDSQVDARECQARLRVWVAKHART
ncbi:MAG: 4-alpha-glucanotransferase [Vicinamibacterales bacterium]